MPALASRPNDHPREMRETMYVATINTPGYLPWDDEPPVFETAQEAWAYLAEERKRQEDDFEEWTDHECVDPNACGYTDTVAELEQVYVGSVYGATPGYDGDHDLGLAYTVSYVLSRELTEEELRDYLSGHADFPNAIETEHGVIVPAEDF